jgi:RHS repeat-associated protein
MPMSVVYTTINGEIVSEIRGGVIKHYVPDTNGNTIALIDDSGNMTDTFTYWPYGELQSHVGTSTTPFMFGGVLGCYTDSWGGIYMRAREYVPNTTQWLTVDPQWPYEAAYAYASSNPISKTDASGLTPSPGTGQCSQSQEPPPIPFSQHPGNCDMPYDGWACTRFCKARGYGTGDVTEYHVNYGVGSNGSSFSTFGSGNYCSCSCSRGNPPGCTAKQISFCMRTCKAINRTYTGCLPYTLGNNDARNCQCSER